ncbi:hypothetical protein N9O13_00795 [Crocinitomicaceae bacterium]|nr:hypothetical protein [Crocinitomicaceae bacterium]
MKKFIQKIFVFFSILIIPYLLLQIIFGFIELNINRNQSEKFSVAIIGNSHSEFAINDQILSEKLNMKYSNYSDGGQSMFWALAGAKKLKHQGVKTFIIEISNTTYQSAWKTTELRELRQTDKKYFLTFDDWIYLAKNDIVFGLQYFFKPKIPSTSVRGRFSRSKKKFTSQIVKENKISKKNKNVFPDYNDEPLHEFIQENKNIEFIIIRVPQHPLYYQREGLKYQEEFLMSKYKIFQKYKNCKVLDFGHLYTQDRYFSDLGHMSSYGSDQFSLFLSDTLRKINSN